MPNSQIIRYSVVIPLKNEEENLPELIRELLPVMRELKSPWELLCIDDGSTDGTRKQLLQLAKKHSEIRPLLFDRNYGQSSAFDAGFRHARGEFIITLDGDLQNDPKDIPKLLSLSKDADLVCGYRLNRQDSLLKKVTSRLANGIRSRFCRDGVRDTGCSLKVYRTSCFQKIKMYNGMHRFLPALFLIEGFQIKEVPVNHRKRSKGVTKYTFFNRSFNTIADMLAVRWMSKRTLHYRLTEDRTKAITP